MSHKMRYAGGVLGAFHRELMGEPIDFQAFRVDDFSPALIEEARKIWLNRFHTEFRSVQIMNRFLEEILGAGDPLDVYAGAVDMVQDEIRHAALCAEMYRALGKEPVFPSPVVMALPEGYKVAPMAERALTTAITMLGISETLSSGFIVDLQQRCEQPVVRAVLDRTIEDEEGHHGFGWDYIKASLGRFPKETMRDWRYLVEQTLAPHHHFVEQTLRDVPPEQRRLEAWPDEEYIPLGLFSPQRQALVFVQTFEQDLAPKLRGLGLL
ncbi:MAG: ferritin-like domain-containing protein [Myxococcales bacterium]|nr:ferritin-like domain-containing protein [Myxococcales bacterium]